MSITIHYNGKLKTRHTVGEALNIISEHAARIEVDCQLSDDEALITFKDDDSENLSLDFADNKLDGFCKLSGNPDELLAVFHMFYDLIPLFNSLRIDDEEGYWYEFLTRKTPCQIELRPLRMPEELDMLNRIIDNKASPPNDLESHFLSISRLVPPQDYLLRVIVQDFLALADISSVDDRFKPKIIELLREGSFFSESSYAIVLGDDFGFPYTLIEIWLVNAFDYKNMGLVKDIKDNARGLRSSMTAALFGTLSLFLNKFSSVANPKHSEMIRLAERHYEPVGDIPWTVRVIDEPERVLEFFFSMMDYLGLCYVGPKCDASVQAEVC